MYQVISLTGPDAESFLQGQLTQDLASVSAHSALPGALLSPKGRVIVTLRILRLEDGYLLLVPNGMADTVVTRLLMYRLRAKVDISVASDMAVQASVAADDQATLDAQGLLPERSRNAAIRCGNVTAYCATAQPFLVELVGSTADLDQLLSQPLADAQWAALHMAAGIVHIGDQNSEEFTPHMLSLDLAGALSFDKGCYTGQEIVARTEHLGKVKRRLHRFDMGGNNAAPGDRLQVGERAIGNVVNVSDHELLAVSPVEQDARELTVNGSAVTAEEIDWN